MSKETLREEIARQTEEFLANGGGDREVIPPVIFCPKSMDWARTAWLGLDALGKRLGD